MFQHPHYPWMLADLDYLVELPDGTFAILECKTTNYNARDKWWSDGVETVPVYYEAQGRHYMAVVNLSRVYFCCLYGNNEDEVIIRHIDRDMAYEQELIALEDIFWHDHVLAENPPDYTEDGELILESLRRNLGPANTAAPPVVLTPPQSVRVTRFLELQAEKSVWDAEVKALEKEMQRMKALIVADTEIGHIEQPARIRPSPRLIQCLGLFLLQIEIPPLLVVPPENRKQHPK